MTTKTEAQIKWEQDRDAADAEYNLTQDLANLRAARQRIDAEYLATENPYRWHAPDDWRRDVAWDEGFTTGRELGAE